MKNIRKKLKVILLMVIFISISYQVNANNEIYAYNDLLTKIELKDSIKRSIYNALLADDISIEGKYSLKDELENKNMPIRVKNQLDSGSCWAFSFSSVLETSLTKKYNRQSKEMSPMHLEYVTTQMFNRTLGSGAGPRLSVAYAVSGKGPVEESQMPFESVYSNSEWKQVSEVGSLNKPIAAKVNETIEFSSIYKKLEGDLIKYYNDSSNTKEYSESEIKATRDLIKQHIKENGAISADIYIDQGEYYNSSTGAYNYNVYSNSQEPNHVVSLVGWDDDYDVNNFKNTVQPKNKGAYIALNSYGENFGKDGYMYISYEDACVEQGLMGIRDIEECTDGKTKYDYIHQYDELGMNLGIPLGTDYPESTVYSLAKYSESAPANKDEYINEIGLYIAKTSGVKVYINPNDDSTSSSDFIEVAVPTEALETGYHTIKLATPIKIDGEKFAIKVKYTNQEGAYVPIEANYNSMGLSEVSEFFDKATANEGETYVSIDGENWQDVTALSVNAGGSKHTLENASACIKVFTTYQDASPTVTNIPVEGVKLNKTTMQLEEGKSGNLSVTFTPSNATNKNVTWQSSNQDVATISSTGVIKAISAGTTTITVTSEDGNKTDTCELTVTEKNEDPDDIYDDKDDQGESGIPGENYWIGTGTDGTYKNDNYGTLSNLTLPKAGINSFIIIIAVVSLGSIFIFIKYKRYKDIK